MFSNSDQNFKNKYLKYKKKYLDLKGGAFLNLDLSSSIPKKKISKDLIIGTEIYNKKKEENSWGKIVSRLSSDDGWLLNSGKNIYDINYNKTWSDIDPFFLFNDETPLYIGNEKENFEFNHGLLIADSQKVKNELEKEDDFRTNKFYYIDYLIGNYIDDMSFKQGDKYYITRSFQPEIINGKTILLGWKEYATTFAINTPIYNMKGELLGNISNMLPNKKGWVLSSNETVLFKDYQKTWDNNINPNIKESQLLKPGMILIDNNGKSWGQLESRLNDNSGWLLSTGNKAYDKTFNKKWFVQNF